MDHKKTVPRSLATKDWMIRGGSALTLNVCFDSWSTAARNPGAKAKKDKNKSKFCPCVHGDSWIVLISESSRRQKEI